jgi:histidyl-tRNA synthetase
MELPRGMKDFENQEFSKIEFIRKNFLETSEIFGFKLMEPSAIEFVETLAIKGDIEQAKDHIFWWNSKKDKNDKSREIGLRFDFTIGISRYVTDQQSIKLPAKMSAFGNVWRYDNPQKGRYRGFNQWDIEIFGNLNSEHDAEIIEFISKFFNKIKLENVEIEISHRKIVESYITKIFESNDPQIITDILRAVDKTAKKSKQEIFSEFNEKGYSSEKLEKIFQFSQISGKTPKEIEDKFDTSKLDAWDEIKDIFESLHNRKVNNIKINFGIVRGLDYYSGIVFEVFDTTNREIGALAGGGRYDTLPTLFGRPDLGATGVAGGVDRIRIALEDQKFSFPKITERISVLYVNEQMKNHAINIASSLRDKGIPVDIDLSSKSLKKQMEQSVNSKFAVIVAPKEFSNGMIVLRNMLDRSEKQVKVEDLMSEFNL